MHVRSAEQSDMPAIVDLSGRVQARLTASGSLQEFGPIPVETLSAHVAARTAFVLDDEGSVIGGVLVEPAGTPVTPSLTATLAGWGLDAKQEQLWFLQKLMVEPEAQGRGIGRTLLDGTIAHIAGRGAGQLVLDCWAGNTKLRDFYTEAGFRLHGVFPHDDYEVAVFTCSVRRHTGSS